MYSMPLGIGNEGEMKYVAIIKVNLQVSPTDGQFFTKTRVLGGDETIAAVMAWADSQSQHKKPSVEIVESE